MKVIKADGGEEEFKKEKIISTCVRAGKDKKTAQKIAEKIKKKVKNKTSTKKIYDLILKELEKQKDPTSLTYRLREAISQLKPKKFEDYAKKVLENHGYQCQNRQIIKGKLVEHEVDVVAKKDDQTFLVEVKRHKNPHRYCGLGTVMEVWARLDDINKKKQMFDKVWMFINTKFSAHAINYGMGKNMRLTGWKTNRDFSLEKLIQREQFPVTILDISKKSKDKLQKKGILTLEELLNKKKLPIKEKKSSQNQANHIIKQFKH